MVDPDLKPNMTEREALKRIIHSPIPTGGLSEDSKMLLYKFRHTPTLTGNKKALTKFLYCVDWTDQGKRNTENGSISRFYNQCIYSICD